MTNSHTVIGFSFLEDVISPEEYATVYKMITDKWKGYFGDLLSDHKTYFPNEREVLETITVLALPVFERSPTGGSRKIILLEPKHLQPGGLPKMANLQVNVGKDEHGQIIYKHDPKHWASERLRTLQKIRFEIGADRAQWITDFGYAPWGRSSPRSFSRWPIPRAKERSRRATSIYAASSRKTVIR